MYRKSLITSLLIITAIFSANMAVSAQTFIARGKVEMRQADGTTAPVEGAIVEYFRTDVKQKGLTAKTNKKGEYNFAGLTFGGVYMFAASAAGAAPDIIPDIKGSIDKEHNFILSAGDGKQLTMDEALALKTSGNYSNTGSEAKLTPAQIKAQEEQKKKYDEALAKNNKIENANKVIDAAVKAGNTAFQAKDYNTAITKYTEGIDADPDYMGSAPILLNNRAVALRQRGIDHYNTYNKTKDQAEKDAAKQDFMASYDSAKKSLELASTPAAASDAQFANAMPKNKSDANAAIREALRLLAKTQIDLTHMDELATLYDQAIAAEPAPDKKQAMRVDIGNLLMGAGDFDKAVAQFDLVLADNPKNVDALGGKGICLVTMAGDDKAKMQEALNVLQAFVDVAPDGHPFKADAITDIEGYKNEQKLLPQKTRTPAKRKP
jgi:tetratricopeptide (TPR) repeat protein